MATNKSPNRAPSSAPSKSAPARRPIPATGQLPASGSTCCICGCRLKIEGKSLDQLQPPLYCPTHGKEQGAKPVFILERA